MKTKLGTIDKLKGLSYNNYEGLLKKTLPAFAEESQPLGYLLLAGNQLPWKQNPKSPEQPLFYVGNTKDWIKWVKGNKALSLKDYSYGTCKVTIKGDTAPIKLLPEKGQLTKPQSMKPLEKVFKKMKPKLSFEVVEEWAAPTPRGVAKKAPVSKENPKAAAIDQKFAPTANSDKAHFEKAIDGIHTPKQLDQHLKNLLTQAKQWEAVLKKNKQEPTTALKELKTYLVQAQQEWKKIRPLYEDWLKKQKIIEDKGFTEARYQALEAANAKIQALT